MTISEKSAYLKGLMDGLNLNTESGEGKMIAAIVDLLGDVTRTLTDVEETTIAISDELDEIEEDLDAIEDYIMDVDEDDEDDEDYDDFDDEDEDDEDEDDGDTDFEDEDEDDDDDDFDDDEDDDEDDEDDEDEPGFLQNVLMFFKGIVCAVLVLSVVVFSMRVLDEKKVISCDWFRDHLGKFGTTLFPEPDAEAGNGESGISQE